MTSIMIVEDSKTFRSCCAATWKNTVTKLRYSIREKDLMLFLGVENDELTKIRNLSILFFV
ncbi:hypothetical protein P4U97_00095 [Bacillus swezeyi]|uniref:hypothetical protein n=1 Tax=Bacillus swezeyi TaxID=1925020 RepID=UPI002E1D472F|nr:hypothetical protein [Bacillus swezeyi]